MFKLWCEWCIILNLTKTEFMLTTSRQTLSKFSESPSLTINDKAAEQVKSAKSLGVYLEQSLNWELECRIENVCKTISSALGAIKQIPHHIPFNIIIKVYNSLVQPHLDYFVILCGKGISEMSC